MAVDLQYLKEALEAILVHVLPFSSVETQKEYIKSLQLSLKNNKLILTASVAFSKKPFASIFATNEIYKSETSHKQTPLVQTT